jgi:hypothetical protein
MAASSTAISRGKASRATSLVTPGADAEILPLPWPPAGVTLRDARRPHRHRCINCADHYRCAGPDESGECAPMCGPCMWVELGVQLRTFQSMAEAIEQRRLKIEARIGATACRRSQSYRRLMLRGHNVVAGFGSVMLKRDAVEAPTY